jgi:large subunit ribosomal protein LP1
MVKTFLVLDMLIFVADRIKKLINASNVKIEPYWPSLFAKAVEGQDINSFFSFGGASSGTSAGSPAAQPAAKEAPKEAAKDDKKGAKKPEPKKVEKPVE